MALESFTPGSHTLLTQTIVSRPDLSARLLELVFLAELSVLDVSRFAHMLVYRNGVLDERITMQYFRDLVASPDVPLGQGLIEFGLHNMSDETIFAGDFKGLNWGLSGITLDTIWLLEIYAPVHEVHRPDPEIMRNDVIRLYETKKQEWIKIVRWIDPIHSVLLIQNASALDLLNQHYA